MHFLCPFVQRDEMKITNGVLLSWCSLDLFYSSIWNLLVCIFWAFTVCSAPYFCSLSWPWEIYHGICKYYQVLYRNPVRILNPGPVFGPGFDTLTCRFFFSGHRLPRGCELRLVSGGSKFIFTLPESLVWKWVEQSEIFRILIFCASTTLTTPCRCSNGEWKFIATTSFMLQYILQ